MFSPPLFAAALILLGWPAVSPVRRPDTEEDLLARIEHAGNPVKKAKYQTRLGRLKLLQAIDAYEKSNLGEGQRLLGAYVERMHQSWQTLRDSGRRAIHQPQ